MSAPSSPRQVRAAIERFLKGSRQPAAIEPGEEPIPLAEGNFSLEDRNARLVLHAWSDRTNLVRRLTGIRLEKAGRLELEVERFGKRPGQISLVDLGRPGQETSLRRGVRHVFREQFRRALARQFPDWKIAELSAEPNLEYSLSPAYPRALLRKSQSGLAALACPRDVGCANGALSFGLIWLDYLRRRERKLAVDGLVLFLPAGLERTTCLRLRHLNPQMARWLVFACSAEGYEQPVDPNDHGNLETRLEPCRTGAVSESRVEQWIERLCRAQHVERVEHGDGSISLRVRGLEFARAAGDRLLFGLDTLTEASETNIAEIERLAAEVARLRSPDAADRDNPLYRRNPERWMESIVREQLTELDASLAPAPVYGQVPAITGLERGVLDLVAIERAGRLAVIELKASEDLHLPVQALDYWMRVAWHQQRGEFASCGYFPGTVLSPEPPRLLLVAPALQFHPTTETILRYFSPRIPVERIGLALEWRRRLKVVFRASGAERPV